MGRPMAALAAVAGAGLPVYEIAPRTVKLAVVALVGAETCCWHDPAASGASRLPGS